MGQHSLVLKKKKNSQDCGVKLNDNNCRNRNRDSQKTSSKTTNLRHHGECLTNCWSYVYSCKKKNL